MLYFSSKHQSIIQTWNVGIFIVIKVSFRYIFTALCCYQYSKQNKKLINETFEEISQFETLLGWFRSIHPPDAQMKIHIFGSVVVGDNCNSIFLHPKRLIMPPQNISALYCLHRQKWIINCVIHLRNKVLLEWWQTPGCYFSCFRVVYVASANAKML